MIWEFNRGRPSAACASERREKGSFLKRHEEGYLHGMESVLPLKTREGEYQRRRVFRRNIFITAPGSTFQDLDK